MFTFSTPFPKRSFPSPPQPTYALPPVGRYIPHTPSPLRTSHNANLMSNPSTSTTKSSPISDTSFSFSPFPHTDENSSPTTSVSKTPATSASTRRSNLFASSPLNFSTENPSSARTATKFQFQDRAIRSSSPQAALETSTSLARTRRKSAFLDRIRSRREDDRFAEKDDQVLRMDFMRERREWREAIEQTVAHVDCLPPMEEEEGDSVGVVPESSDFEFLAVPEEQEELSPTEDKEIEELLSLWRPDVRHGSFAEEERQRQQAGQERIDHFGGESVTHTGGRDQTADDSLGLQQQVQHEQDFEEEDDAEDYDRLFMQFALDHAMPEQNNVGGDHQEMSTPHFPAVPYTTHESMDLS